MKKTSRTFKRFAAITSASLLAACMVAPMAMTSNAVDGENSITISNEVSTHEYQAYQIFDGKLNDENTILSNIEWGKGVVITNNALNELADLDLVFAKTVTYSIPETETELKADYDQWVIEQQEENPDAVVTETAYYAIVEAENKAKFAINKTPYEINDEKVASKIAEALSEYDDAKSFADVISKYLTTDTGKIEKSTYNSTNKNHVIASLDDGYYLIQDDMSKITGNDTETATRYIVYVLGNETIDPKSSKPEMEKKVAENDKYADNAYTQGIYTAPEEYNDVADWNIGDDVPFELIGTMPSDIGEYKEYYYQFTDTLADGLTLNELSISVTLVNPDSDTDADNKPDESEAKGYVVSADEDGHGFTITFNNIKNENLITEDTVVVVDYTAKLNSGAEIGLDGNLNTANLTYSNNPNWKGAGEAGTTSKTPDEKVIVFTYELDVDKIAKGTTTKLFAEFVLYREVNSVKQYAKLDANNRVSEWVADEEEATVLKTNNGSDVYQQIKVIGLDDGEYYLEETKEPDGYNLPSDPFTMNIVATTDNSQDWDETDAAMPDKALTALKLNTKIDGDLNSGIVATSIENTKGNELPSTGGIGTTVFYLGGGAMVAVAGIYLISKKRMKNTQE